MLNKYLREGRRGRIDERKEEMRKEGRDERRKEEGKKGWKEERGRECCQLGATLNT